MIRDLRFYKFLGLSIVFYLGTIMIMLISSYSTYWIENWFSDRFFTFQFSIIFLIGCSIIDKHYSSMNYTRYNNRTELITEHFLSYVFLSFVITSIVIFISVFSVFFAVKQGGLRELVLVIDKYFRFILGLNIVGSISLNIKYSNFGLINKIHHVISYMFIVIELMVLPNVISLGGNRVPLIFSWLFVEKASVSYIVLLLILGASLFWLYKKFRKVDLMG